MVEALSPAKLILFGEHAVVYDKLGISTTVTKYTKVSLRKGREESIIINSKKFGKKTKTKQEIEKLVINIDSLRERGKIKEIKELVESDKLLPSFYVIGKLAGRYGYEPCSIEICSEVPKNLGSSASVFSAVACAYSKFLKVELSKQEIGFFANEGDKLVHGNPSGIDAYTISYGGWISYRKSEGIKPLEINFELPLLVVDSLEPAKTGECVEYIREQMKKNTEFVNTILDRLDEISHEALKALRKENISELGNLMLEYYKELKKLNISTPKLDEIVKIAMENKAFAKPTGGWGGGCCIVLASNPRELEKIYKTKGYYVFNAKLGAQGVRILKE